MNIQILVEQSGRNISFHAKNMPEGNCKIYYMFLDINRKERFNSISPVSADWSVFCSAGDYIVEAYLCRIDEFGKTQIMELIDQQILLSVKPCIITMMQSGKYVAFHVDNLPEGNYKFFYKFKNYLDEEVFNSISVVDHDWTFQCPYGRYIVEAYGCRIDEFGQTIAMELIDQQISLYIKPCVIKIERADRKVYFHATNVPDGNYRMYYKFFNEKGEEVFNSVTVVENDWTFQCPVGRYTVKAFLCGIDESGNTKTMEYIDQHIVLNIKPCVVNVEQNGCHLIFRVDKVPRGNYKLYYKFFNGNQKEAFNSITTVDSKWEINCPIGKYTVEAYLCSVDQSGNTIELEYIEQPISLTVGPCIFRIEQFGLNTTLHADNVPDGNYKLFYKFFNEKKEEIFTSVTSVDFDWTFRCRPGNYIVEAYLCEIDEKGNAITMKLEEQQILLNVKPCVVNVVQSGRYITFRAENVPEGNQKLFYKFFGTKKEDVFTSVCTVDPCWMFRCPRGEYIVEAYLCITDENGNAIMMEQIDQQIRINV